ncbi:MAG: right-handed parallel beta-helix repeat-containing protein [Bacteroidales bacterium]|nr:right-handed parallel beta-helix repeat-containing protein [Bacteroidales bacterium]
MSTKPLRFLLILLILCLSVFNAKTQHYIDSTVFYLKGGNNIFAKPGDTVYLMAGKRDYLLVENIHGSADSAIVFINHNGVVSINTNHYFGISFTNCTHFKITGTGISSIDYGIDIQKVSNGAGMGIGCKSSFCEVDHIRFANTLIGGLYIKSDPDTSFSTVRDSFLLENVFIHHNLFENNGDEGMYIGSTKYHGQVISFHGKDTLVLPHLLKNVIIASNRIFNAGWDGIQLSSASFNSEIRDNLIVNSSHRGSHNQMSGIMLGGGTKANCFNNMIIGGKGSGIVGAGLGGQMIYNNIIVNAGENYAPGDLMKMQHGIYIGDISTASDSSYKIINNLIINPKSDGIRFTSLMSKNNLIANNVIINPGNYNFYDTIVSQFDAEDAFIMISDNMIDVDTVANLFKFNSSNLLYSDTSIHDYTLLPNSPLIDRGIGLDSLEIFMDFYNNPRLVGQKVDLGPFEFNTSLVSISFSDIYSTNDMWLFPNPAQTNISFKGDKNTKIKNIRIFTIEGKLLQSLNLPKSFSDKISMDINHLKTGIYIVKIVTYDGKQYQKQLIKTAIQ